MFRTTSLRHLIVRSLGSICPRSSFVEKKVCDLLNHSPRPYAAQEHRVKAGNGFFLTGDVNNAAYVSGLNERAYMNALSRLIEPGQTVFNIGANIGYVALWLAQHFSLSGGSVKIVAFEPEPTNFEWLQRNLAVNQRSFLIRTEAAAVGADEGRISIYSSGRGDGAATVIPSRNEGKSLSYEVRLVSIDGYCLKGGKPHCMILDVEDFGGEVIRGARSILSDCHPIVSAEIHSDSEFSQIDTMLKAAGYSVYWTDTSAWGQHAIWH